MQSVKVLPTHAILADGCNNAGTAGKGLSTGAHERAKPKHETRTCVVPKRCTFATTCGGLVRPELSTASCTCTSYARGATDGHNLCAVRTRINPQEACGRNLYHGLQPQAWGTSWLACGLCRGIGGRLGLYAKPWRPASFICYGWRLGRHPHVAGHAA